MPRVTQSHRDRQTARILLAAQTCFARKGFRATSMDEIIAEVGMSSSTVYRYFPQGKDSLISAVLDQTVDPMVGWLDELAGMRELPEPREAFLEAIVRCLALKGLDGSEPVESPGAAIVAYSWVELSQDPNLRGLSIERFGRIRAQIRGLVARWQQGGAVTDRLDAVDIAAIFHHLVLGLIVDRIVSRSHGLKGIEPMVDGVLTLLAPPSRASQGAQTV